MSFSSRTSIPPLSRPPTSPASSGVVAPSHRVWRRYVLAGAIVGALLSLCCLGGREDGDVTMQSWQSFVLSTIFSSALAGLLLGAWGTSLRALCFLSSPLRLRGAQISAFASSLVLLVYVLLRGAGEAFRWMNHAPFNLGTWEFLVGGMGHLFWPIVSEYSATAVVVLVLSFASVALSYRFLTSKDPLVPGERGHGFPLAARGLASAFGFALLVKILITPAMAVGGGLHRTADLSFLASVGARSVENDRAEREQAEGQIYVPEGAALSTGELWQKTAKRLEGPRPNVLLIMMESVGLDHLGYEGYERATTPALDTLARESVRFRTARATASHSNYAQMAVLSSLFPRRFSGLDTYRRLDYPRVLWHDFLGTLGYVTATHSSQDESWQGMIRFQKTDTKTEFHHAGTYEGRRINMGSEKIVPDQVTITRAIKWIDKTEGPWGLYVNLQSTHFPYRIPQGAPQKYTPTRPTRGKFHYLNYLKEDLPIVVNRYDNALSYVDAQIGRIYQFLKRAGKLENTIVVVTADHGELFWDHDMVTHGRSLFEKEVRVPLLIRYPSQLSPRDELASVSTLDILPTVAELLNVPSHPAFQGVSLLGGAAQSASRPSFMNIQGMKSQDAVICGRLKFINNRSAGLWELYDLSLDEGEQKNLAQAETSQALKLHLLLQAQMHAQMRYHSPKSPQQRAARYAPRFASCPLEVEGRQAVLSN